MLSLKFATWIQNAFLPFKTQRNARKLLAEAKCESSSLFWIRGIHFKPKNMENLNGKRVSLKFTMNFELVILISNWTFFFSTYKFKIDLEFIQISNSTTRNRVWVLKHVEMSFKCLNLIQNASYSFRTHKF